MILRFRQCPHRAAPIRRLCSTSTCGQAKAGDASLSKKRRSDARRRLLRTPPLEPPPPPSAFPTYSADQRDFFSFEVLHQSRKSAARVGRIHTPHGVVDTPSFVGVATNGAFKALDHGLADDAGLQLMFCNTYHLMLRPGPDVVEAAGGLHEFIGRSKDRPIITDSGGFQVFSMSEGSVFDELNMKSKRKAQDPESARRGESLLRVTEEGAHFRSYVDSRKVLLTPESSVRAQKQLGADIIIPFDELPPYHIDRQKLVESVARTHRWEARSLRQHLDNVKQQAMYCVVHGGIDRELRMQSAEYLTSLPFDGVAIGGSLGKDREELEVLLRFLMPALQAHAHSNTRPVHLLGIADVESLDMAVPLGVDTFDSCFPLRIGRHGTLLTSQGRVYVRKGRYANAYHAPDPECDCPVCSKYSLAYLHHLMKANEPMAWTLCTLHNLHFMVKKMERFRQRIMDGDL